MMMIMAMIMMMSRVGEERTLVWSLLTVLEEPEVSFTLIIVLILDISNCLNAYFHFVHVQAYRHQKPISIKCDHDIISVSGSSSQSEGGGSQGDNEGNTEAEAEQGELLVCHLLI